MKYKPYTCLDPLVVRNRYTHELVFVPCGKCESCQLRKANDLLRRVDDESKLHSDIFFVTLSYAPEFVPTISISSDGLVDGAPVEDMPWYDLYVESDDYRFVYPDKILHLDKTDVQKFIKRLRFNINQYVKKSVISGDAAIRYYCIGEYGGTTKRPHYHLLFFFDNSQLALHFAELVRLSWTFNPDSFDKSRLCPLGNIECERPRSTCSSYVTAYLTSPGSLSPILTFDSWKPFYLASSRPALGSGFFNESHIKNAVFNKATTYLKENKKHERISLPYPKQFKNRYFPKLAKAGIWTIRQSCILYSVMLYFPYDFAHEETSVTFKCYVRNLLSSYLNHDSAVSALIERYLSYSHSDPYDSLYRLCYLSRVFIRNYRVLKQYKSNFKLIDYATLINDYYVRLDYVNLKAQLQFQEDYSSKPLHSLKDEWILGIIDPLYQARPLSDEARLEYSLQFNTNVRMSVRNNAEFKNHRAEVLTLYQKRIKSHFDRDYLLAHPEFAAFHHEQI